MRLLPLALLPLSLGSSSYASQQQPLQVYLYPTSQTSSQSQHHEHEVPPTLSADQAKTVLTHHLGGSISDFDEIPNDEGLWGHLVNMWDRPELGQGMGMAQDGGKARVVFIDGGVSPQDVLPTTLPSQPSFYLSESSSTNTLLAPYLNRASHFLASIMDSLPALAKSFKDTFELAGTKAASALGDELNSLTALVDSIPWIDHSGHSYPWEAITISGLKDVEKGDEVWETGREGVKAGLAAMTTPDSPPLLLIIRPDPSFTIYYTKRATPSSTLEAKRADSSDLAKACYSSNDTCSEATSCNGRGSCVLKSKTGDKECWGCRCASGFAGVECQKTDYSVPFIILIFSTVFLVATLIGSVSLLMTIGETKLPSTLNLAIGGPAKRD